MSGGAVSKHSESLGKYREEAIIASTSTDDVSAMLTGIREAAKIAATVSSVS